MSTGFVTAEDAARFVTDGHWSASETLQTRLAEHAAQWPDRLAVVDDSGGRLTYAALQESARNLSAALASRGVGPGDYVGIQLPNRTEAVVAAFAVEKLGAIVCPLVPAYRDHEMSYIVGKTQMKVLIVPGEYNGFDHDALARRLGDTHACLHVLVTLGSTPPGRLSSFAKLVDEGAGAARAPERVLDPDAVCAVLFTSGTESDPKGILHTHNTLLSNARSLITMLDLTDADGVFMASPVGHGTGYGFGVRLAAYLGSTLALQGRWDPSGAVAMMTEHSSAYTHGAIPFVEDLLALPDDTEGDLSALRYFVTGGAAIPPGTAARVEARLGCQLLRLYGQTEGFMATLNRPGDPSDKVDATDGRPVPGVEVRAVDDDGHDVQPGETGHCVYRGPHRCVGFLDDEARAAASLTADGWFRSGDLVSFDGDGYLRVVGRSKEVINRGGYKFSPREVEEALQAHPAVVRAAVVGIPDPRLVERPCAFLILAPGSTFTQEQLMEHLKSLGIAKFKWPERLEVLDQFPMTPSGKVQKFQLLADVSSVTTPLSAHPDQETREHH